MVEVQDFSSSKGGFVFGLDDYVDGTYRYFLVGFGGHDYTSTPEYYITYNYDVNMDYLKGSSNNQSASGTTVNIVDNTSFDAKYMTPVNDGGRVFIGVKQDDSTSPRTVTVTIGPTFSNNAITGGFEKTFQIGTNADTASYKSSTSGATEKVKNITTIKGGIGAYGMIQPAANATTPRDAINKYSVRDENDVGLLAAEEE